MLQVLKGGCPLSGQQGLPPQPAALLGPLQLSRREIFTGPGCEGFRQGMTCRMYGPFMLLTDCCLGREPMDGVGLLFTEQLTDTKHSDFGISCLSLTAWQGQDFWALCSPVSQSLGREMEARGPARQAMPYDSSAARVAPAQPRFPAAAFLVPPHTHPQGCKSPEMVKMQQHFSPVLHVFEDRRQAGRQTFSPFPMHLSFTHMQKSLLPNHKDLSLPRK